MQLCNPNIIELLINHISPRRITVKRITMTLDLNQILARNDYKRMTAALKEKVEEVAKRIRQKMDDLDIIDDDDFDNGEIGIDNIVVRIVKVKSNSGFAYEFLGIKRYEDEYSHTYWASLEDIEHTFYFCNDYNAKVYGATNKEALAFLNVAAKLIAGLGEVEEKQANNIQTVLKNLTKVMGA